MYPKGCGNDIMDIIMVSSAALSLPVVHCCIFKLSVTVINPQPGHCASAPTSALALEGWDRMEVWSVKFI